MALVTMLLPVADDVLEQTSLLHGRAGFSASFVVEFAVYRQHLIACVRSIEFFAELFIRFVPTATDGIALPKPLPIAALQTVTSADFMGW